MTPPDMSAKKNATGFSYTYWILVRHHGEESKDLLLYGLIHRAGMARANHCLVEELLDEGHIQVLVFTATLGYQPTLQSSREGLSMTPPGSGLS